MYKFEKPLHEEDSQVLEFSNGSKFWYKKGRRHRIDGPAIEFSNGKKCWYLQNKHLKEKYFNSWIKRIKIFI